MIAKTYLAFDYGISRMGVAVGQTVTEAATPLGILHTKNGRPQSRQLDRLVRDWTPDGFVLGMPDVPSAPHHTNIARRVRSFASYLNRRYGKPYFFIDERFTSRIAEIQYKGEVRQDFRHSLVAQILLNDWLRQHGE